MRAAFCPGAPAPAVAGALAVTAGIVGAVVVDVPPGPLGPALAFAGAIALVAGLVVGRRALVAIGGLVLLAWAGHARARSAVVEPRLASAAAAVAAGEDAVFEAEGRLSGFWRRSGSMFVTELEILRALREGSSVPLAGEVLLAVAGTAHPEDVAGKGTLVRVRGPLRLPEVPAPPVAPFGPPPRPRLVLKSAAQIEVTGERGGPLGAVERLHRATVSRLRRNLAHAAGAEAEAAAFVEALLLGETSELPGPVVSAFRDGGVAHVLSISGLHVGLVALALAALARRLRLSLRASDAAVLAATLAFALFAGWRPPVARSALMIGLYLAARLLGRPTSPWQVLGASATVLLVAAPADLFDVGFLLSFSAVAGLCAFAGTFASLVARAGVSWRPLSAGIGATLAAELAVFPVQAALFAVVPFVAIVSNLVVVPLASAFLLAALTLLPLLLSSPLWAAAALAPLTLLWSVTRAVLEVLDAAGAVRFIPRPPFWAVVALAGLLAAAAAARGQRRGGLLAAALSLAALLAGQPAVSAAPGSADVIALDVGQGDAWLLVAERGRVLIDGGGSYDAAYEMGRARLLPRLAACGATSLDAVVLTHPHPDHGRGLLAALGVVPVGRLVVPRGAPRNGLLDEVLGAAGARRIPVTAAGAGETLEIAGLSLRVLHPGPEGYPRAKENNGSLVLRVEMCGRSLLFTGDVEAMAERDLVARSTDLSADVLKVAHHGSRTSSTPELLAAVAPRVALVGVGRRNRFGHPAPEVMARLAARRVRVFRTDADGDVALRLRDGHVLPFALFGVASGGGP